MSAIPFIQIQDEKVQLRNMETNFKWREGLEKNRDKRGGAMKVTIKIMLREMCIFL